MINAIATWFCKDHRSCSFNPQDSFNVMGRWLLNWPLSDHRRTSIIIREINILNSIAHLEEHADYLFSYAMLKLRNVALAEDMVQDTLLSAVAAREGYTAQASVRTWLTAILKHKIIDHWRRQGREIAASDLIDDDGGDGLDDFFDQAGRWFEMPKAYPDPDAALESKEFWIIFEQCLSRLKPQQAEVFLAREVHGMSNEEIRENFALSESNAWVLLHRARVALGKCLDMNWMK